MRFRSVPVVLAAVFILLATGGVALGSQWSMPVEGGSISTPFGVSCVSGVHRGIDLTAEPGSPVRAPAAGKVVFAGSVPADGGGTCYAVTIETGDGLKASLLPLEAVHVAAGDTVRGGDPVGRLAPAGDDSDAAPHLHLGLRAGDAYLDPAPMLPVSPGSPEGAPLIPEPAVPAAGGTPASTAPPTVTASPAGTSAGEPAVVVSGAAAVVGPWAAAPARSTSAVAAVPSAATAQTSTGSSGRCGAASQRPAGAGLIEEAGIIHARGRVVPGEPAASVRAVAAPASVPSRGVPGVPSGLSAAIGGAIAMSVVLMTRTRAFVCAR